MIARAPLTVWSRGPRAWVLLVVFTLVAFLPGFFVLPPLDRDESRFAQASRQMIESGNWVDIRFQETARHKKPVGIYWLQAGAATLVGEPGANPIWAYRLPSLAGAIAAVLLCFAIGRVLFGAEAALVAALLLASCLVLNVEARLAKTDAVLLASLCCAQLALARIYLDTRMGKTPPGWTPWIFWLGQGIGILIKGPIVPLVSGLTAVALAIADRNAADRVRWWRALRPWPAALVTLAIVVPWLIAISVQTQGGFVRESVGGDLIPKLLAGEESHGAPPGYYLALFSLTFWPGSLIALLALPWVWANRAAPAVRFCVAWIVPAWLVFEAVPTKLPHYSLPTYPAIAILAGAALFAGIRMRGPWAWIVLGWWIVLSLALVGVVTAFGSVAGDHSLAERLVDAFAMALALAAACLAFTRGRRDLLVGALAMLALVVQGVALERVLPDSDAFWVSRAVGKAVAEAGEGPRPLVASAGYTEPSLVFTLGTGTRLVPGAQAADLLADHAVALALVDDEHLPAFQKRAAERGVSLAPPHMIWGYNYSRGKPVSLALYQVAK